MPWEHSAHTTRPQALQWCRPEKRFQLLKTVPHAAIAHLVASLLGCQYFLDMARRVCVLGDSVSDHSSHSPPRLAAGDCADGTWASCGGEDPGVIWPLVRSIVSALALSRQAPCDTPAQACFSGPP